MLSQAQLVMIQQAVEKLYDAVCRIVLVKKSLKDNGAMEFSETVWKDNIPCRLSFESKGAATSADMATYTTQKIRLFLSKEIVIPEGAKIVVTQQNRETAYEKSGAAAVYPTHQEIGLTTFQKWT